MEVEIWKPVVGYEGLYEVSNLGRIKSLPRKRITPFGEYYSKEKILKGGKDTDGYMQYILCREGIHDSKKGHRLVMEAFIGKSDLPCINHKDEDKTNNKLSNLEYCTVEYNNRYGTKIERQQVKAKHNNKHKEKMVIQMSLDNKILCGFPCAMEAARQTGFQQGNISKCCRGEIPTAYGYKWKYLN